VLGRYVVSTKGKGAGVSNQLEGSYLISGPAFQILRLCSIPKLAKYKYLLRPPLSKNYHSWFSSSIKHVALSKGSSMLTSKAHHTGEKGEEVRGS
jgi:hypothetical protein